MPPDRGPPAMETEVLLRPLVQLPDCVHIPPHLTPYKFGSIITVKVGCEPQNQQVFQVYEGLLRYHSSYFRDKMERNWEQDTICLPEEIPRVFKCFFGWIYAGELYDKVDSEGRMPLSYHLLSDCYSFGDRFGIPEFCNTVLDLIFQDFRQTWNGIPAKVITHIYNNTRHGSSLRRLLVDFAVDTYSYGNEAWIQDMTMNTPREYLSEVLVRQVSLSKQPSPSFVTDRDAWTKQMHLELCARYHDHTRIIKLENKE